MKPAMPGGVLEEAVLNVLWELGRASARDVYRQVGEPAGLAYTTVAKVLDRLHLKRLVSRTRRGNAFLYAPAVGRDVMTRTRLKAFLERVLGPAPTPAMASLVDAVESVNPDLLDELSRAIAARRKQRHGS
jgi:predicted transcriptional regulator